MDIISDYIYFFAAGALLGAAAVGATNATRALLGVSRIINAGLENIAPAQAAHRFHHGGVAELTRYLVRLTVVLAVLTGGTALAIALAPEFWLQLAFGSEYSDFGSLVQWWAGIHFLYALVVGLNTGLFAMERTKAILFSSVLSATLGLAFAYALIIEFELNGVLAGIFAMVFIRLCTLMVALYSHLSK